MPTVDINGKLVDFPDDLPPDKLKSAVSMAASRLGPESSFQEMGQLAGKSTGRQIWEGMKIPEQMSKRGLSDLANMVPRPQPTGNVAADLARGTPGVIADTLKETAPGFVSRLSMLAAGAAPALKLAGKAAAPIGRAVAGGLEDWAGIRPAGTLSTAAKDASLIFAKGKDAAGQFYKAEPSLGGASIFSGMYKPEQIVDTAREYLAKGGQMEPSEGLMYRKAVDALAKSGRYVKDELYAMRQEADAIAKSSENIAAGDAASKRGMMANAMRSIFPKNVGGRASPFKVGEALALSGMGPAGKAASALFSPIVLGAGATAGGAAARIASDPGAAVSVLQAIRRMRGNQQ